VTISLKKKTHGEDRDALDHFQFVLQMFHGLVMITYFVSATDWINQKRTQVIVFEDSYSCNVTQSYRCYLAASHTESNLFTIVWDQVTASKTLNDEWLVTCDDEHGQHIFNLKVEIRLVICA
jgi:hypothetical protein